MRILGVDPKHPQPDHPLCGNVAPHPHRPPRYETSGAGSLTPASHWGPRCCCAFRMDNSKRSKILVLVLGTVFATTTGLLAFLITLRTLELTHAPMGPPTLLLLGSFGALVTSIYTSVCLRIELDLRVALPPVALGAAVMAVAPYSMGGLVGLLTSFLVVSLTNSLLGATLTERFRGVDQACVGAIHHLQSVLLVGAIAWSFSDMTVRCALAIFGLIAFLGWHPSLLGGCALTLLEAKLDCGQRKSGLTEKGFILHELEERFGIRVSTSLWDRLVRSGGALIYSYWVVDLFT